MRFWDSSSLGSLFLEEPRSIRCRRVLREDDRVTAWFFTPVELEAAMTRAHRGLRVTDQELDRTREQLRRTMRLWALVRCTPEVQTIAEGVARQHGLRGADSLQLAAALSWVEGRTKNRQFVTGDAALAEAADLEGFTVVETPNSP